MLWSYGGSDGKGSACNAGDLSSVPGSRRSPGEGNGMPVFLPGESLRQRSLAGYSPQDLKEMLSLMYVLVCEMHTYLPASTLKKVRHVNNAVFKQLKIDQIISFF